VVVTSTRKRLASIALAAGVAVTGGAVTTIATAAPAAAAVPYKIPNGTWGGHVRTIDVPLDTRNNGWTLVRRKTVVRYRMVDGRWQERVYSIELYAVHHV